MVVVVVVVAGFRADLNCFVGDAAAAAVGLRVCRGWIDG